MNKISQFFIKTASDSLHDHSSASLLSHCGLVQPLPLKQVTCPVGEFVRRNWACSSFRLCQPAPLFCALHHPDVPPRGTACINQGCQALWCSGKPTSWVTKHQVFQQQSCDKGNILSPAAWLLCVSFNRQAGETQAGRQGWLVRIPLIIRE